MPRKKNNLIDESGLTPVEKVFASEYLDNGNNGTQAYLKAHPEVTKHAASTCAGRLLAKVAIQRYIKELEQKALYAAGVSREKVISEISCYAFQKGVSLKDAGNKLAALDKLCKISKLYKEDELPPCAGEEGASVVVYIPQNSRFQCA